MTEQMNARRAERVSSPGPPSLLQMIDTHATTSQPAWRKQLHHKQPFPDNYVHGSFLAVLEQAGQCARVTHRSVSSSSSRRPVLHQRRPHRHLVFSLSSSPRSSSLFRSPRLSCSSPCSSTSFGMRCSRRSSSTHPLQADCSATCSTASSPVRSRVRPLSHLVASSCSVAELTDLLSRCFRSQTSATDDHHSTAAPLPVAHPPHTHRGDNE